MNLRRLLALTAAGVLCALLVRTFIAEGIYVASASMEPTLPVGRSYILEKIRVKLWPIRRGDIVVFTSPVQQAHDSIKRVIALPGDSIEIRMKAVWINGTLVQEPYVRHTRPQECLDGDNLAPMTVPAGMVFVMGDNRDESGDSRDWTDPVTGEHRYFLPVSLIKGTVLLRNRT
jgi:signal peptidase I